jgi:hypothetical protein
LQLLSYLPSASRNIPTSTARSVRSSSQSDQQLGEGAGLRVPPELADPVGPVEVGEHQDVEELGAGSRPERAESLLESALEFVWAHRRSLRPRGNSWPHVWVG